MLGTDAKILILYNTKSDLKRTTLLVALLRKEQFVTASCVHTLLSRRPHWRSHALDYRLNLFEPGASIAESVVRRPILDHVAIAVSTPPRLWGRASSDQFDPQPDHCHQEHIFQSHLHPQCVSFETSSANHRDDTWPAMPSYSLKVR